MTAGIQHEGECHPLPNLSQICRGFTLVNGFNEFEIITVLDKRKFVTMVILVIECQHLEKMAYICPSNQRSAKGKITDSVLGSFNV